MECAKINEQDWMGAGTRKALAAWNRQRAELERQEAETAEQMAAAREGLTGRGMDGTTFLESCAEAEAARIDLILEELQLRRELPAVLAPMSDDAVDHMRALEQRLNDARVTAQEELEARGVNPVWPTHINSEPQVREAREALNCGADQNTVAGWNRLNEDAIQRLEQELEQVSVRALARAGLAT